MKKTKTYINGIDINRSSICYTQYLPEERVVANIGIQPLETENVDYFESVKCGFDELFKKVKLPKENIVTALAGECAIIKKIVIDSEETDIDRTISWELGQQLLLPLNEISFDYQKLSLQTEQSYQKYLVVAYRTSLVNRMVKTLKSRKLNPVVMDVDLFALINVFETNYQDQLAHPSIVVYTDADITKIVITQGGNFYDVEILNHARGSTIEEYSNLILEKIGFLSSYYSKEFNFSEAKTYICGSYCALPEVSQTLLALLPRSEILFPFRTVNCSVGMDIDKLQKFAPQLAVSVGCALRIIPDKL